MKTTNQLLTNTTNRQPLTLNTPRTSCHFPSKFIPVLLPSTTLFRQKELNLLQSASVLLQKQLEQAKQQQRMMMQLFESLSRVEQGQQTQSKKTRRRCNQDIVVRYRCPHNNCQRYYSSQDSLHRHAKMKHNTVKTQPPLLYRDLPPEPNLTTLREDEEEQEHSDEDSRADLQSSNQHS